MLSTKMEELSTISTGVFCEGEDESLTCDGFAETSRRMIRWYVRVGRAIADKLVLIAGGAWLKGVFAT